MPDRLVQKFGGFFIPFGVLFLLLCGNALYLAGISWTERVTGWSLQNYAYQYAFLLHLVGGFLFVGLFIAFAVSHVLPRWRWRRKRVGIWGLVLLLVLTVLCLTGVLLSRIGPFVVKAPLLRSALYWAHLVAPLLAVAIYVGHRRAGGAFSWRRLVQGGVAALLIGMLFFGFHWFDPRFLRTRRPQEGTRYFEPSLARTASGGFIPAGVLMDEHYCKDCHPDVHKQWAESAHRFSSFNNPVYLASVRETRQFSLSREGTVRRARWCAGCHDPVPFFSGAFDDPNFDDVHDPLGQAGLTCTSCHGIVEINSVRGNADYVIEEPLHYPFAFSTNPVLRWINHQLILAKPEFHKRTFLKPFHRTAEFCSVCHKVHIPEALNDYKFLRGQNHYDSFLLSGVSGHSVRSFYYPPVAKENCAECHMPPVASQDFGAKTYAGVAGLAVKSHLFPGANTALPYLRGRDDVVAEHQAFLKDVLRIDLFGLRWGATVDGPQAAPLRPRVPLLVPGQPYVLEVVVRNLKTGHAFTQGTTDSNEVWINLRVEVNGQLMAESGALDAKGEVDRDSYFLNVFMLDRNGNRIARRNPQDIFVPLYDHQIPPGAAAVVHYLLDVPREWAGKEIRVEARVLYRKFDWELMHFVVSQRKPDEPPIRGETPQGYINTLPITEICRDVVTLPVAEQVPATEDAKNSIAWQDSREPAPAVAVWERWNDYGIGLLLKGKSQLRQAREAFEEVEKLGVVHGPINLARAYQVEGELDAATAALQRTARWPADEVPWWTVNWLSAVINRQQGHIKEAADTLRQLVLQEPRGELIRRRFDFRWDYEVINLLGETLFDLARRNRSPAQREQRDELLREAVGVFKRTLALDPENVTAHYNLALLYQMLGQNELASVHREAHQRYKPDDNARDFAVAAARARYPWANRAAEAVAVYRLKSPLERKTSTAVAAAMNDSSPMERAGEKQPIPGGNLP